MTRPAPDRVRRVACVGAGIIGAGWASVFLSRGMEVVMSDPGADAEARARALVEQAWPLLSERGLADGADRTRLRFVGSPAEAVAEAEFVQESAPEREQLKIDLFAAMDAAAPADTVMASSSSAFLPSRLQSRCTRPGRVLIGHPFAPSYLMPLVEVVGGGQTDSAAMDWAVEFYAALGKTPLRLEREIDAYVANRLQFAVFEEMAALVREGVCDYQDIDTAMVSGPGLRWAFAGPVMCYHLGGGKGGVRHMIDHFGWKGEPAEAEALVAAVERMAGHLSMDQLEAWRDANLSKLIEVLQPLPPKPGQS